jgi:hypothetical protein
MADSRETTDHNEIRKWTEARGGKPAVVKSTHDKGGGGILRIEFPKAPEPHDENLEPIPWDEFFRVFDREKLAFLFQEKTAGGKESRFFKFVDRS